MRSVSRSALVAGAASGLLYACSPHVEIAMPAPDAGSSSAPGDGGSSSTLGDSALVLDAGPTSPVMLATPGTTRFVVPWFQQLTVEAWGGGGTGGVPGIYSPSPSGEDTRFGVDLIARGGQGGSFTTGGHGGSGAGGTIVIAGGSGAPASGYNGGAGGSAPHGGTGGAGGINEGGMIPPAYPPLSGGSPGGGGGGHGVAGPGGPGYGAAGGGAGAYVARTYLPLELPPGTIVVVTVGHGGASYHGGGGDGAIVIRWQ